MKIIVKNLIDKDDEPLYFYSLEKLFNAKEMWGYIQLSIDLGNNDKHYIYGLKDYEHSTFSGAIGEIKIIKDIWKS